MVMFLAFVVMTFGFAQTRYIPHVTSPNGGFTTNVLIENSSVLKQEITLTPCTIDGGFMSPLTLTLDPSSTSNTPVTELFVDGEQVSHFMISADDQVRVLVAYDFASGENSSPAHVSSSDEQATRYRMFHGNWDQVFDGIAVVNTGSEPTDVWLSERDAEGNYIASRRVISDLAPNAKGLYVIGSPSGSEYSGEGVWFEIFAEQSMAITALRGTVPGQPQSILWANDTRILGKSENRRDDKGVWFITGGSLYDVIDMMGYNLTVDRLWQAELFRRNSQGTLAELFGSGLVRADEIARTIGYTVEELVSEYERQDEETKILIDAYVNGINRRISQVNSAPGLLPFEFTSVGIGTVVPWTRYELMAWLAQLQRSFTNEEYGFDQVQNAALFQELTAIADSQAEAYQMFDDLRWRNDPMSPTNVPENLALSSAPRPPGEVSEMNLAEADLSKMADMREVAKQLREDFEGRTEALTKLGARAKMGSYSWALSGDKTESGNAILYSGPQMTFTAPVNPVEGSIESDALTVSGMTIFGVPGIIIGRTPNHAWGFQVGQGHVWDFYVEEPTDIFMDREENLNVLNIFTGEMETQRIRIWKSSHGPVIRQEPILTWKYSMKGYEFDLAKGLLNLSRAKSMDEFGEAAGYLGICQHLTYADNDGNIAYWMSGRVPKRDPGEWRVPQGWFAASCEWDAADIMPMPQACNPESGWIAGWNTKPSPDFEDSSGTFHFGMFQRAHIIQDYLRANDKLTYEQARDLAINISATTSIDFGGAPWSQSGTIFTPVLEANINDNYREVLELLNDWDHHMLPGGPDNWVNGQVMSDAYVLQRDWLNRVLALTFADELGPTTLAVENVKRFQVLLHMLHPDSEISVNYNWFQNKVNPDAPQTPEEIILQALADVQENLGPRPYNQSRNTDIFLHSLLGDIHVSPFASRSTYSQCIELGENGPERIESILALGQSGTILSDEDGNPVFDPNYTSMTEYYDNFIHRVFPLFGPKTKKAVDQ